MVQDEKKKIVPELVQGRRKLFRRLIALAGVGLAGALLSQKTDLLPGPSGTSGGSSGQALIIDASPPNTSTGTTELNSTVGGGVFPAVGSRTAVRRSSSTGLGLFGSFSANSSPWRQGVVEIMENLLGLSQSEPCPRHHVSLFLLPTSGFYYLASHLWNLTS